MCRLQQQNVAACFVFRPVDICHDQTQELVVQQAIVPGQVGYTIALNKSCWCRLHFQLLSNRSQNATHVNWHFDCPSTLKKCPFQRASRCAVRGEESSNGVVFKQCWLSVSRQCGVSRDTEVIQLPKLWARDGGQSLYTVGDTRLI